MWSCSTRRGSPTAPRSRNPFATRKESRSSSSTECPPYAMANGPSEGQGGRCDPEPDSRRYTLDARNGRRARADAAAPSRPRRARARCVARREWTDLLSRRLPVGRLGFLHFHVAREARRDGAARDTVEELVVEVTSDD